MSLSVVCSSCGAKLRAPDNAVGRAFKCPKCGNQISVAVAITPGPEPPRSLQVAESTDDLAIKRRAGSADEATAPSHLPLGFGIASLVLSVIGIVFSVFPCVGVIGIPLSALGLLLGLIGAVFALVRQGRGIGFPLAGSITGFTGLAIAVLWFTVCSGIFSSGAKSVQDVAKNAGQVKRDADARKNWPAAPKMGKQPPAQAPAKKPFDGEHIDSFLGISSDFNSCAMSDAGGVKVVDLKTGENLASPKWDRDWGYPFSAAFGKDVLAVVTSKSIKLFSRKTGELEQNIHGDQIYRAGLTADGGFLAFTGFRPGGFGGHYLVLRDILGKKAVAEVGLGGDGYCSLAVAGKHAAACMSKADQITVVGEGLEKKLNFRKSSRGVMPGLPGGARTRPAEGRIPLAISPAGNLIAFGAEDAVVLYDIDVGKVAHKLEGHLDTVQAVAFSPNGEIVASAAKDKTIRFWHVKQGKEIHVIKNLPASTADLIAPRFHMHNSASELIFSADGSRIAVVGLGAQKAEIRSVGLK